MGKSLAEMQAEVVENNKAKGWYEKCATFPEAMALLHSEVSEALEAWRIWGLEDGTAGSAYNPGGDPGAKPEGVGSEFADILIRLLDYCHRFGIDLEAEYERKLAFNRTRAYRHGNKRL
jgi:NTP pyrophosphatase (non-canonical NTP hydrolase)